MKKNNLYTTLAFLLAGAVLGIFAFQAAKAAHPLSSILFGMMGGMLGVALSSLRRYLYWNRPQNRERYQEHLEQEAIELGDERKEMLRNRAGRQAYKLGLLIVAVSITLLSVLEALGIIAGARMTVLYLGAYLIFQYIAGIVIYRHLSNKY